MTYGAADLERIFAQQLQAVGRALSSIGAEYMMIGGLAVGAWAAPRATKDCDLSVHVVAATPVLRAALAHAGLEVVRGDLDRAHAAGEAVRLQRAGSGDEPVVVDLLFATTAFEIEALGRRQPVRVFGVDMPVATPEDLLIFKLIAGRPQDIADAHALLDLHAPEFDMARVRRWCGEFDVVDRLDALLANR